MKRETYEDGEVQEQLREQEMRAETESPVALESWHSLSLEQYLDIEERMRVGGFVEALLRLGCTPEQYAALVAQANTDAIPDESLQMFEDAQAEAKRFGFEPAHVPLFTEAGAVRTTTQDEVRLLVRAHAVVAKNGVRPTDEELAELRAIGARGDSMNLEAPLSWVLEVRGREQVEQAHSDAMEEAQERAIPDWARMTLREYLDLERKMRVAAAVEQLARLGCPADLYVRYASRVAAGGRLDVDEQAVFAEAQKSLRTLGLDVNFPGLHDRQGNVITTKREEVLELLEANKHMAANGVRPTMREVRTLNSFVEQGHAEMQLHECEHVLLEHRGGGEQFIPSVENPPRTEASSFHGSPAAGGGLKRLWTKVRSFFRR